VNQVFTLTQEVQFTHQHIQLIKAECKKHSPNEACGVLVGRIESGRIVVVKVVPIKNSRPSDRSFELDPQEHYRAWNLADKEGLDIVGVYHTHPHSQARPSTWDKETMENDRSLWIIAGIDGIKGYEWDDGVKPVEIIEVS
jgi:proteasome lid subunit RPN8/RPN11